MSDAEDQLRALGNDRPDWMKAGIYDELAVDAKRERNNRNPYFPGITCAYCKKQKAVESAFFCTPICADAFDSELKAAGKL